MKRNINLFIVGAVKCGTTSLYNYLSQHPDAFFPKVKELNYYSNVESRIKEHYKNPIKNKFYQYKIIRSPEIYFSLFENSEAYKIIGDSSTSYLWDKESAERIQEDFPNAKIIIMLRNPIKRAFSHFLMLRKSGQETEHDFYQALKIDKKRQPKVWGKGAFLYEELGLYFYQVALYYKFFKKSQIKVIIFENFTRDVREGLLDVFSFLEIDSSKIDDIDFKKTHNPFSTHKSEFSKKAVHTINKFSSIKEFLPQSFKNKIKDKYLYKQEKKPKINRQAKEYLKEKYKEDIVKLGELLDKDLSIWK